MKHMMTILLVLLLLTGCTPTDTDTLYQAVSTESGFDTKIQYLSYTKDKETFDKEFERVKSLFWTYHQLFDNYHTYDGINNLMSINNNAGIKPLVVDDLLFDLLLESKKASEESNGYFDVTYGAVFAIWHEYREAGIALNQENKPGLIPPLAMLEEAKAHVGWDLVQLNTETKEVFITDPKASIDLGGIAKGYATELVAQQLEQAGVAHAVVNGGGNVRTIGTKLNEVPWSIGVQVPTIKPSNQNIEVFSFPKSMSVVTSGNYQRYYQDEDQNIISHILNPKTLYPDSPFASVSIFTKDSTLADVLSTTLYVMDYETGKQWLSDYQLQHPDVEIGVMWISESPMDGWTKRDGYYYTMSDNIIPFAKYYKK